MRSPVTHASKMTSRTFSHGPATVTLTGTLCNRMVGHGDINCTEVEAEVTCKFCLKQLSYRSPKMAADILQKLRASGAGA